MKSGSRLERVLRSGRFAVTAELNPPDSADPQAVYDHAVVLSSVCDAINCTDASGANVHMSNVGVAALLARAGYDPVVQFACRDRNRISLQGDVLGAAALGVKNVMCLTGDGVQAGDQPEAKPVFDLDSITLIRTVKTMRDKGRFLSGRPIESPPKVFIGGAENPFAPPYDFRPLRVQKKVQAGVDFIQTQYCYDMPRLREFMKQVCDMGLDKKVFILIGVGPLRSPGAAEWMRTNVPGIVIPDAIIERLNGVEKKKQRTEGKKVCIEIIQEVKEIAGVSGVHVMAYKQEELVAEIVEQAGLLPRYWSREPETASNGHVASRN
ncbi:MAG: methylenetetrahydrofolate reductase [SAR202 cluster bacterium]|nr:methylenetetrahydrofolate reductase [SAR202 cluster bacterium]